MTIKLPGTKLWKSSVQSKTLNPVWNETHRVEGKLSALLASPMVVKVIDKDQLSVDENLGLLSLSLAALLDSPHTPPSLRLDQQPLTGAEAEPGSSLSLRVVFLSQADAHAQQAKEAFAKASASAQSALNASGGRAAAGAANAAFNPSSAPIVS